MAVIAVATTALRSTVGSRPVQNDSFVWFTNNCSAFGCYNLSVNWGYESPSDWTPVKLSTKAYYTIIKKKGNNI